MNRFHITVVAALLALAAVLGTFAATRTVGLGTAARNAANTAYAARVHQLNAFQARLQHQLLQSTATPATRTAVPPRVVYHRPPPIVVVHHTHAGEGESEHEGGDGGND